MRPVPQAITIRIPFGDLNEGTLVDDGDFWEQFDTSTSTSGYWFGRGADQKNVFIYSANDGPITEVAQGSPAVVIISNKSKIKVERHSLPSEKYQSTLDRDNELRIAAKKLVPNNTSNLCVWATDYDSPHTFYLLEDPTYPIAKGKVVFPLSAWQGTANYGRLNITIIDDELTGIMGVKEYINNVKNSDAIYNLQGVRVSATQKGQMYIQGGKKFIQK